MQFRALWCRKSCHIGPKYAYIRWRPSLKIVNRLHLAEIRLKIKLVGRAVPARKSIVEKTQKKHTKVFEAKTRKNRLMLWRYRLENMKFCCEELNYTEISRKSIFFTTVVLCHPTITTKLFLRILPILAWHLPQCIRVTYLRPVCHCL